MIRSVYSDDIKGEFKENKKEQDGHGLFLFQRQMMATDNCI